MRILAAITDPLLARRILACMSLPSRAPPLAAAADPEPLPDLSFDWRHAPDFDQTPPGDWDTGA